MELVFSLALCMVGVYTFINVFTSGAAHGVQTQRRAAANMIAQSYLDEFRAHTFGSPAPSWWAEPEERPVRMVVKDRETFFSFQKKIEYETGAFVDGSKGNRDKVILTVSWSERIAKAGGTELDEPSAATGPGLKNEELRVEMPVWR
jgi:hypothetical protein